jgi:hypothetical protein
VNFVNAGETAEGTEVVGVVCHFDVIAPGFAGVQVDGGELVFHGCLLCFVR